MNKREIEMIAQRVVEKLEALRIEREGQMMMEELERLDDFMKETERWLLRHQSFMSEQVVTVPPKQHLLRRIWNKIDFYIYLLTLFLFLSVGYWVVFESLLNR
jgi:hypothetical protein